MLRARDIPFTSDTEKSDDKNNNEVEDYFIEDYISKPSICTSNKFEALNVLCEDSKSETSAGIDLKVKLLCPVNVPKPALAASPKIN